MVLSGRTSTYIGLAQMRAARLHPDSSQQRTLTGASSRERIGGIALNPSCCYLSMPLTPLSRYRCRCSWDDGGC